MFGGTPSNLSISVMDDANVEAIAGVNLPMLIKLATIRADNTLRKAVDLAKDAGKKYIIVASQVLSGES
jgi:mannose PTS system EIIA component